MWAKTSNALGVRLLKPSGIHILPPYALGAGPESIILYICSIGIWFFVGPILF